MDTKQLLALCKEPYESTRPVYLGKTLFENFPLPQRRSFKDRLEEPGFLQGASLFLSDERGCLDEILYDEEGSFRDFAPTQIEAYLAHGYTLGIRRLQLEQGPIRELCLAFIEDGWHAAGAALFESDTSRGIPWHWDTHPTVILQAVGQANWHICPPVFALENDAQITDEYRRRNMGEKLTDAEYEQLGQMPNFQIPLEPGDAVFIPTGWLHKREPQEQASTHILFCPASAAAVVNSAVFEI